MNYSELKKMGNKVYSLTVKIEESKKSGMVTRIPGYVEKLKETKIKLVAAIEELEKKYPLK